MHNILRGEHLHLSHISSSSPMLLACLYFHCIWLLSLNQWHCLVKVHLECPILPRIYTSLWCPLHLLKWPWTPTPLASDSPMSLSGLKPKRNTLNRATFNANSCITSLMNDGTWPSSLCPSHQTLPSHPSLQTHHLWLHFRFPLFPKQPYLCHDPTGAPPLCWYLNHCIPSISNAMPPMYLQS